MPTKAIRLKPVYPFYFLVFSIIATGIFLCPRLQEFYLEDPPRPKAYDLRPRIPVRPP